MAELEVKQYLDYDGLKDYDYLLKNWIKSLNTASSNELQEKIDNLELLVGDEKVEEVVSEAIANLVDSAPQTFDTLKEIADWIESHGEAAAALVATVAQMGEDIVALDTKIDNVYDAIQSISGVYIEALFLEPVAYDSSKTVVEQIAALEEGQKLVIDASEDAVISEDIAITSDCVIEAEGVEFSGAITVDKDVEATVIGATFSGPVTIQ